MKPAEEEQLRILINWLTNLKKLSRQRQKEKQKLIREGNRSEEEYEMF